MPGSTFLLPEGCVYFENERKMYMLLCRADMNVVWMPFHK